MGVQTFVDFVDPRDPFTAVYCAAQKNRFQVVRLLHELRADLDKPETTRGHLPIGMASQSGHTAIVQLLDSLGADIHRESNDGARPIHVAARNGRNITVVLLLSLRSPAD